MVPKRPVKRVRAPLRPAGAIRNPAKPQAGTSMQDDPASVVFSAAACALLAKLRANQAGARIGSDPEYLHQMRVTVRRLRAILPLYCTLLGSRRQKKAARELGWLARTLGPARDSDVFLKDIWPPLREKLGQGHLTETLNHEWQTQRKRYAHTVDRALASPRYRHMMRKLERWFSAQRWRDRVDADEWTAWNRQAQDFARHELARRAARVYGYGPTLDKLDAATLHRLRIGVKKLRYVMDVLIPLFRQTRVKTMQQSLSALQDILGAMNDVAVAAQKVDAALPRATRVDLDQLQAQIAAWHVLRLKVLKRKLNTAWRAYRRVKPFW